MHKSGQYAPECLDYYNPHMILYVGYMCTADIDKLVP